MPGLDAHRLERAHAADAEQHVLREARVRVADVEPRRDPARGAGRSPGARRRAGRAARGRRRRARSAPSTSHVARSGTVIVSGSPSSPVTSAAGRRSGIGVDPVLVLPAAGVDALAEVALAVHQADGDERQRAVGGLLEDVAGERAEAAGVDRQRAVDAELGAEVRDRALGRRPGPRRRAREVGAHALPRPRRRARAASASAAARASGSAAGLLQQPHRVLARSAPSGSGSIAAEDVGAARRPGPAVVVGEPGEPRQRLGHAGRERVGGAQQIVVAGVSSTRP